MSDCWLANPSGLSPRRRPGPFLKRQNMDHSASGKQTASAIPRPSHPRHHASHSLYPHRVFTLARQKPFPYKARGSRLPPHRPDAQIAQLVEQRIENPRVAGSIPALGTITFSDIIMSPNILNGVEIFAVR